jgi:hypothetical protein
MNTVMSWFRKFFIVVHRCLTRKLPPPCTCCDSFLLYRECGWPSLRTDGYFYDFALRRRKYQIYNPDICVWRVNGMAFYGSCVDCRLCLRHNSPSNRYGGPDLGPYRSAPLLPPAREPITALTCLTKDCDEGKCCSPVTAKTIRVPCKECGCDMAEHRWFNSEFVECLGKGRPKVPPPPAPFPEANCKCQKPRS